MSVSHMRQQASARVLARVGRVIQQKYRIDRLIGVGGMAAVYAATHRNGYRVAIKYLLERFADEPQIRNRFSREAYLANEVGHPGTVPVLDDDVDEEGNAFLIMPLLEGETLRKRWERAGKRLPMAEVGVLMSDVLDVLACAHAKGIVHRDVKPENLFIASKGHVRVLDFGIARRIEGDGSATVTGAMIGTPAFMPPEQALGNREAIGPHSDCWAVGATIFTLLSGEFVHVTDNAGAQLVAAATRRARSLGDVDPSLPGALVRFVDKALAFDRADRWPSAAEMRDALLEAFEEALGDPLARIASGVREELVRELLHARPPDGDDGLPPPTPPAVQARYDARPVPIASGPTPVPTPSLLGPTKVSERAPWRTTEFPPTRYALGGPTHLVPVEEAGIVLFLRAHPPDPSQSLWETDLATGAARELLRPDALCSGPEEVPAEELARRERQRISAMGFASFQATRDGSKILVASSGRLHVLTRLSGEVHELPTGSGPAIDPQLSPDGTRVAYVREHDVYVMALGGEETVESDEVRITHGGTELEPHGLAEFIAQEELRRSRGFWWSPDGRAILYEEADLSAVQRMTVGDPAHPERAPHLRRYPRAGTPNAMVRLAIAAVPNGARSPEPQAPRKVTWDTERYPYLATVTWTENAPPTIYVLDRLQQTGVLLAVDPQTGQTRELLTEQDDAWLNVDSTVPRWLRDGSGFLWSTERRGGWQLELRDRRGTLQSELTAPEDGYRSLLAVSSEERVAYVARCSDPTRSEVWSVPLGDAAASRPLAQLEDGLVHASFGDGARVYAFSEGTRQAERRFGARSVDGTLRTAIPSAAERPPFKPRLEYTTVGREGFHVAIVRPQRFDPNRKYALIDAVYGGPHKNVVTSDALAYLHTQWIADRTDAIVVAIDVHGTMWRGRAWERKLHLRLGEVPLEGHVAAIGALASAYPEMDPTRVGIYGASFGGYFTAMAILRRPDVFKVGVASSPAVDWTYYDTCYTERYLGIPPSPAYENASLLTWAARPPSPDSPARPLLVVHGTVDDNVYFANSLKLAHTMGKAGRPLEFVPLVGVGHMFEAPDIAGPTWARIASFLRGHL